MLRRFDYEYEKFSNSKLLGISNHNSVIYLVVFGDKIGDILFGVFVPIGILVFIALIVTVLATNSFEKDM